MHLVLLGDSIFDNGNYVRRAESVRHHLQRTFGTTARATLVAVDGNITADILDQVARIPADATHLALGIGGNDMLKYFADMGQPAQSVNHALMLLSDVQREFAQRYDVALQAVLAWRLPVLVCTVYDAIPDLPPHLVTALSLFNDVITRAAMRHVLEILDLRELLRNREDYSSASPIEPSEVGGAKIAEALARWVTPEEANVDKPSRTTASAL